MKLTQRLQEAFDKRVCGTAMLPASDLLSAMTAIEQLESTIAQQAEAIRLKDDALELESDAIKDLMEWCVKNIAKWHFPQYDDLSYAIKKKEKALAIQPSPEILQAQDDRVQRQAYERAAACVQNDGLDLCADDLDMQRFYARNKVHRDYYAKLIRALIEGD